MTTEKCVMCGKTLRWYQEKIPALAMEEKGLIIKKQHIDCATIKPLSGGGRR